MYAIETYYLAPTNTRGARVMEGRTADGGPALGPVANHKAAAQALATRLGWAGEWVEGAGPSGSSVWVLARPKWGGVDMFRVSEGDQ